MIIVDEYLVNVPIKRLSASVSNVSASGLKRAQSLSPMAVPKKISPAGQTSLSSSVFAIQRSLFRSVEEPISEAPQQIAATAPQPIAQPPVQPVATVQQPQPQQQPQQLAAQRVAKFGQAPFPKRATGQPPNTLPIAEIVGESTRFTTFGKMNNIRVYNFRKTDGTNGVLMQFVLSDFNATIRCTIFDADRIQLFTHHIRSDRVVRIQFAMVQEARQDWGHRFELNFSRNTLIFPYSARVWVPRSRLNLKSFAYIDGLASGDYAETMGILVKIGSEVEMRNVRDKVTGVMSQMAYRQLFLNDINDVPMLCAVWGEIAQGFTGQLLDVMFMRNVQVQTMGGRADGERTLSVNQYSVVEFNPAMSQTAALIAYAELKRNDHAVIVAEEAALNQDV